MIEYELNNYYNFNVTSINGNRIYLKDEDNRRFHVYGFDFQTEWDYASPQVAMGLKCFVKDIEEDGNLKLEQSNLDILQKLYPTVGRHEKKAYPFTVEKLMTNKNGELLLVVSDAYGITQIYKPTDEHKKSQPGDELELTVAGIRDKGNNRCNLVFGEEGAKNSNCEPTPLTIYSDEADEVVIGEFGMETETMEFKSSIVYPARATGPDIDSQMQIIVKTLAGFMNAKGGKLLIGVNDNGTAIGIENEYQLLNSSAKDKFVYKANSDGYQNKIGASIRYYLSDIAADYVSIQFLERKGHTICSIDVLPSQYVIWFNDREAYKRQGNSTIHLRSAAIEKLVLDKMHLQRPEAYMVKPTAAPDDLEETGLQEKADEDYDVLGDSTIEKQVSPASIKKIGEARSGKGSFYINLFSNGQWSWTKDIPSDLDLEFCIPINSPASQNSLMMVYEDGCVNRVNAYNLHKKFKTEGKRYENGRRDDGVKLKKAFHAKQDDLVACFSIKDGHEFVKVHMVSDVSEHDLISLKGNRLINKVGISGVTDANIYFVSAIHTQRVSALKKTGNQKSNSLGYQMDVPGNSQLLLVRDTLRSVCDVLPNEQQQ